MRARAVRPRRTPPGARAGLAIAAVAWSVAAAPVAAATTTAPRADRTASPAGSSVQAPSGEELEALTREVSSQLRCVVCQGLSIEDSPSDLAREMKSVVRDQLAAGRSPEQVRQYFVDTYGEWILLEPEATGFNLAVYILPVVALAAGVAIVIVVLRRWTRDATDAAVASEPSAVPAGGPTDEGVMDDVSSDR